MLVFMKKYLLALGVALTLFSCTTVRPLIDAKTTNYVVSGEMAAEDTAVIRLVSPYKQTLSKDMSRVLAVSDSELLKDKPESNLTNFMADMLLEEGRRFCAENGIDLPQVAYVNYGGIRSSLPEGEITVQKIFELMPFENEMVFVKITAEKFYEMVQKIAERDGDGVAGIKLGIRDAKVASLKIDGKDFEKDRSYVVVTNDYIAQGGDNMVMFLNPQTFVGSKRTIRDLIIHYMERLNHEGKIISAKKDGRIFYE